MGSDVNIAVPPLFSDTNITTTPTLQPVPETRQPVATPPSMEDLARMIMLGDGGILEQFVENTLDQLIPQAMRKARVREARAYLLAFSYGRRWRRLAWTKKLARQGRERRQNFAQSLRAMSKSSRASTPTDSNPIASLLGSHPGPVERSSSRIVPEADIIQNKRHSLPHNAEKWNSTRSGSGSMLPPSSLNGAGQTRPQKAYHKRSHTMTESLSANNPGKVGKFENSLSASRGRMLTSQVHVNESLIKKAQRLVSGRMDATQTDYFRLKAMGLDPDTPVVPRVLKRTRVPDDDDSDNGTLERKYKRVTPPASSSVPTVSLHSPAASLPRTIPTAIPSNVPTSKGVVVSSIKDDDLEDLLRRAREAREAMAADTEWMRETRATMSRSRSNSHDLHSSSQHGLGASMPSRTTLRLERTGGHGFYERAKQRRAEGAVNGTEKEKSKEQENTNDAKGNHAESSDGLELIESPKLGPVYPLQANWKTAYRGEQFASSNPFSALQNDGGCGAGTSADDAIEL
jgi:hypothetical protein